MYGPCQADKGICKTMRSAMTPTLEAGKLCGTHACAHLATKIATTINTAAPKLTQRGTSRDARLLPLVCGGAYGAGGYMKTGGGLGLGCFWGGNLFTDA